MSWLTRNGVRRNQTDGYDHRRPRLKGKTLFFKCTPEARGEANKISLHGSKLTPSLARWEVKGALF